MAKEFSIKVKTVNIETTEICFDPTGIPEEKKSGLEKQIKQAAGEIARDTKYMYSLRSSEISGGRLELVRNPAIENGSDKNKILGRLSEILRAAAAE